MPVRRVSAIADRLPGSSAISHNSVDYAIAAPALGPSQASPFTSNRTLVPPRSSSKGISIVFFKDISSAGIKDHVSMSLIEQIFIKIDGKNKILIKLGTGAILPANIDPEHWARIKSTNEFVSDEMDFFVDVHGVGKCSLHYLNRGRTFKYIVANDEAGKKHLAKFVAIAVKRNGHAWPGYSPQIQRHSDNSIKETQQLITKNFYVDPSNYFGKKPEDDNWVKFARLVDGFLEANDVAVVSDRPTEQNDVAVVSDRPTEQNDVAVVSDRPTEQNGPLMLSIIKTLVDTNAKLASK
jgi:hypothetical protein